mgnify:FL=1
MAKYQLIKDLKTDRLGSDIVIANARLLKDAESGDMLIQVRLKKVSDEPVSEVNVKVICLDGDGKKIGEDITESFACNVQNGEYFGVKHPIRLEVKDASDAAVSIARVEYPGEENAEEAEENEEDSARNDSGADEIEEAENAENDSAEEKAAENDSAEEAKQSAEPSESPQAESTPAEAKSAAAAEDDTVKKILLGFAGAAVLVLGIGAAVHFGTQNKPAVDAETLIAEVSETTVSSAAEGSADTAAGKTETVTEAQTETETQLSQRLDKSIKAEKVPAYDTVEIVCNDKYGGDSTVIQEKSISDVYEYTVDGVEISTVGVMYTEYEGSDSHIVDSLNMISKELKKKYDDMDRESFVMDAFNLKDEYSGTPSYDVKTIRAMSVDSSVAQFECDLSHAEYAGFGYPIKKYHLYDMTFDEPIERTFQEIFLNSVKDKIYEVICEHIKANPSAYIDNCYDSLYNTVYSDDMTWYFNSDGDLVVSFMPWIITAARTEIHEEIIPYSDISEYFSNYGKRTFVKYDPDNKGYPHGNTIGNIMNYSAYTSDSKDNINIYYAGGKDGYSWHLCYVTPSAYDGGTITDDYTDSVLYYDGWIYYRTYSDNNCLYRIKPDRTQKTKLSSSKVSRFNIDRGKLYFRENDVFCEANLDGSGKRVIINSPCYGSFVTDGCVYYLTSDSTGVICYNIDSGTSVTYNILNASYQIKFFTVEDGYIYLSAEGLYGDDAVAKYSIYYDYLEDGISFNGLKVYSFNMNNDYIYAAVNTNGTDQLLKISKSDFSNNTSYYGISITREFDIIGRTIYYFDEDGTAYQTELP